MKHHKASDHRYQIADPKEIDGVENPLRKVKCD